MCRGMIRWVQDYQVALLWVTGVCAALFVATLVLAPVLILRIPADYFAHRERPRRRGAGQRRIVRVALAAARNAVGYLCIMAGVAMLLLPGQGLLTVLIGFLLVDFPAKYRVEKWVVSRRRVLGAINWFRRRRGREPLVVRRG